MNKKFNINLLRKRLLAIFFAVTFLFFLIGCRLTYLQLFSAYNLTEKALDQWTRDLPITAERGRILDRNGEVLADNVTTYNLYVRPRMTENEEEMAKTLSIILGTEEATLYSKLIKKGSSEFTLALGVSEEIMKKVESYDYEGIYYSVNNERYYPYNELACQILGYVSIDGEGQSGLEKYFNQYLRGVDGQMLSQGDLLGIEQEDSERYYIDGQRGLDVQLTLDRQIQQVTENALKKLMLSSNPVSTSAIVMDINNGDIVALANFPSFDLNNPPRDDLEELMKLSRNTLITDIYEPGSTFKVLTAAANVEEYLQGNENAFSPEAVFGDGRTRVVDGQTVKCWDKHINGKHSNQDLSEALMNSCNPIFVDIALSLGKETMYDYLEDFGYGKATGVDYQGESGGMLISENFLKSCDLARISFGQTIAVTGLQLVNATASAVNGGNLYTPTFLDSVTTYEGKNVYTKRTNQIGNSISEEASAIMRNYLYGVVEKGSGSHAKIDGYKVGGKTGTAQKYIDGHIASGKYISSFVGFFGKDEPEYIALVLVNEPEGIYYGSTIAAPVAKEIFEGIIAIEETKKED